jgi:hypothetical protein
MGRTMYANSIAERKLLYASINAQEMREVTVRVYAPVPLKDGDVSFKFDQGASSCRYEFEGLPEEISDVVYGADSLQALQLATSIDGILKKLSMKYQFYYPSGEPYFDE